MRRVLIGGQPCAHELNSGERLLAGGGCIGCGRTPAKPPWSEVTFFLDLLFRYQRTAYNDASSNSVFDTLFDDGNYGEFLIYSCLEDLCEE
jgi:hypothetical protein